MWLPEEEEEKKWEIKHHFIFYLNSSMENKSAFNKNLCCEKWKIYVNFNTDLEKKAFMAY